MKFTQKIYTRNSLFQELGKCANENPKSRIRKKRARGIIGSYLQIYFISLKLHLLFLYDWELAKHFGGSTSQLCIMAPWLVHASLQKLRNLIRLLCRRDYYGQVHVHVSTSKRGTITRTRLIIRIRRVLLCSSCPFGPQ